MHWFIWLIGTLLFLWYGASILFAVLQEEKVGWQRYDRKIQMVVYVTGMMVAATFQSILGFAAHWIYGLQAGRKFSHKMMQSFHSWFSPALFGPYVAEGVENLPPKGETCIYIANHQSTIDFTLFYVLPHDNFEGLCAIAKSVILYCPGFGAITHLCGGMLIKRGKKGTTAQLLEQAPERIKNGINIGLFPQGTRSVPKPGTPPMPFKKGFMRMAAKTQARVVPLTFLYGPDFMSSDRDLKKNPARVIVHPPVSVPESMNEDEEALEKLMQEIWETVTGPIVANYGKKSD